MECARRADILFQKIGWTPSLGRATAANARRGRRRLTRPTCDWEGAVPQYNFLCRACKREFSKIMTLSEHEKGGTVCPHCKSKDVEQRRAAFFAVTSKKS